MGAACTSSPASERSVAEGGVTFHRWTKDQSDWIESLVGDVPLVEITIRYRKKALVMGWPPRTAEGIRRRLKRMGYQVGARAGQWVTPGAASEMLGGSRYLVDSWLRVKRTAEILQPVRRGNRRFISRESWRRLARRRPQVLGGIDVDRLFNLLEDRALAEAVVARYPVRRGDWRVRCVETGQVWANATQAAAALPITQSAITLSIRQRRAVTALGMTFEALREPA